MNQPEQLTGESELALIQNSIDEMRANNRRASKPIRWYWLVVLAGPTLGIMVVAFKAGQLQGTVRVLQLDHQPAPASATVQARP